jgi:lipoyl(octanoyl) transferase
VEPLLVVDAGRVDYSTAYGWQRTLHARRVAGEVADVLLLLEHPHVYTLGRRFRREHLVFSEGELAERGIELHEADRGGSITYHGPGQLVAYPVVDLRDPGKAYVDVIRYVRMLEAATLATALSFGCNAHRRDGITGVWVGTEKLAAIGVNVSRGVSKHGLALNVSTDLAYFRGMVPCGLDGCGVTSMEIQLGRPVELAQVAGVLARELGASLRREPAACTADDLGLPPAAENNEVLAPAAPAGRHG